MCVVRAAEIMNTSWYSNGRNSKANLVFIGCGGAQIGNEVGKQVGMFKAGARLLVDDNPPWFPVYRALGAKQTILGTFYLTKLTNFVGLLQWPIEILKNGKIPLIKGGGGDPFLQGAICVFDVKKQLFYRQIETSPGYPVIDHRALKQSVEDGVGGGLISVRARRSKWDSISRAVVTLIIVALIVRRRFFK
jgi:hypothetical protein